MDLSVDTSWDTSWESEQVSVDTSWESEQVSRVAGEPATFCVHGQDEGLLLDFCCDLCREPACSVCWLVSSTLRQRGYFQRKICPKCDFNYDENHKGEMDKLKKAISGIIEAGKVKSRNGADPFTDLCNEFCQILVDGAGQAHFRLLADFGDVLNRVLKV